jgi:hypothetical protein
MRTTPIRSPSVRVRGACVSVRAVSRADDDRPRYLGKAVGYVHNPAAAMDKLEAVDEHEQQRQTREAHEQWCRTMTRCWGEAATTINRALDDLVADVPTDSAVRSGVRAVRRSTQALGRRLGA